VGFKFPFQKQTTHHHELMNCLLHFFNYCCISFNCYLLYFNFHFFNCNWSSSISSITTTISFLQLLLTIFHFSFSSIITTAFYFFNCYCISFSFSSSITTAVYFFNCYCISFLLCCTQCFIWGVGFCIFFNLKNMISTHTQKKKKDLCKKIKLALFLRFQKKSFFHQISITGSSR
jgi:hypothetical protein